MTKQLTEEQQAALDLLETEFQNHLNDHKGRVFQINGPAGTGKTELIRVMLDADWIESYVVCAPTHKACKVLQDRLGRDAEVMTCHKFLSACETYDKTGKMTWSFKTQDLVIPTVIILDEVSMVGVELFHEFHSLVQMRQAFLVTTGDACQLPPVEDDQTITVTPFYSTTYPIHVTLTRNLRNTRRAFNKCLNRLRGYIEHPETAPTRITEVCNYLAKYVVTYSPQFGRVTANDIPDEILHEFVKYPGAILLAHRTNARANTVGDVNQRIRRFMFGSTADEYVEGDRLIFTDYYRDPLSGVVMHTNDMVELLGVEMDTCDYYGEQYSTFQLRARAVQDETSHELTLCVVHPDDRERWRLHDKRVRDDLRTDAELRQLPDSHWKTYYEKRKQVHAPLDYAYCVSVHKSQGSTYRTAFVFLSDFAWMLYPSASKSLENRRMFYKLLYVALSRSQSNAYVF
jgi:exodeoxyribonuclease-5